MAVLADHLLSQISPGDFTSLMGALPEPHGGAVEGHSVVAEIPEMGTVRIHFQLYKYRHRGPRYMWAPVGAELLRNLPLPCTAVRFAQDGNAKDAPHDAAIGSGPPSTSAGRLVSTLQDQ